MTQPWDRHLTRWTNAGVIDAETAARIRAYEAEHAGSTRLRWPVVLALGFGAVLVGAGILLFVSAHWNDVSPAVRFLLVLAGIASLHAAGAASADRIPIVSSAFHAAGTIALGAGIFQAAQIFNLQEHWPSGVLLWAIGAAIGWGLLRDPQQLAILAIVAPIWLAGEWIEATRYAYFGDQDAVVVCGFFLMALAYFTAPRPDRSPAHHRLFWIGGVALVPCGVSMAIINSYRQTPEAYASAAIPTMYMVGAWAAAFAVPIVVALAMQGRAVWRFLIAAAWVAVLAYLGATSPHVLPRYAWWALGAIGLIGWGVESARTERINMGSAALAATIVTFYFSEVMDRFGRSASLVGLGLLFIVGGWSLERTRRRLIRHVTGTAS